MRRFWIVVFLGGFLWTAPVQAQPGNAPEDPAHQQLRDLKDEMIKAFNGRDIEGLLTFLHPDVVVTWQDGTVSRKREGVRKYYQDMLLNPKGIVESLSINQLDVAELSILYGPDKDKNTAISFGAMNDHYQLRDGMEFSLHSHWTVTAVKVGGKWLIASAHLTTNAFDNEVQTLIVKKVALWTISIALIAGLLLGILGTILVKRRRRAAGNAPV
jgi:ketosteroid isomerase-like protein